MSIKKKINLFRKKITKGLTSSIGSARFNPEIKKDEIIEIKYILISRPNHRLGNQLLITPLVQEIVDLFPNCKIDLLLKGGLGPIVFENYENVNTIIRLPKKPFKELKEYFQVWASIKTKKYDLAINIDRNSSSGRLSTQFSNSKYKFFGSETDEVEAKYPDFKHIAKYPVYNFRNNIAKLGFKIRENEAPMLNLKLSDSEIAFGKKLVEEITKNDKPTICIYTFATGAKCYNEEWWNPFYEALSNEFTDFNIIEVLPIENVSQIGFKAPSYYSKDVREIGSFLANTALFIGADSGIMHLSSASQIPTIGLFSVTDFNTYQPYGKGSLAIDTNKGGIKDYIKIVKKTLGKEI